MKTYILHILTATMSILCISSCKPTLESPAADKGSLDLTTYVALGNSITSGYSDNALYYQGQQVSYANLLAQQLRLAGGGAFKQPLVDPSSVGIGLQGNARLLLAPSTDCKGITSLAPVRAAASGDLSIWTTNVYASQGPFNNMGVPAAKAITTVYPGYGDPAKGPGNYNPFFYRMASNPSTASILSDAAAQNPTFFSLFIGNNDVLLYALNGGAADSITPSAGAPGVGFDASVDLILSTLTANGAKGIVANIPDITSLPFFTTVPYNGLVLNSTQAATLSAAYSALGISFQEGANAFIIEDAAAPGGLRKIQQGEYILLSIPQDSLKCKGWGATKPIKNEYVLTASEVSAITSAVSAYNVALSNAATTYNLAYVDVNQFLKNAVKGITYNGITVSTTFVSGGAFSLDGVHLTPIGNALLANECIKSINTKYGSAIPFVDASDYSGVRFP